MELKTPDTIGKMLDFSVIYDHWKNYDSDFTKLIEVSMSEKITC